MHRLIYESKRKQRINNIAIYYITPHDKAAFVVGVLYSTNYNYPTGNLDSKKSQEIVDLLKTSNQKYNQTLIIITHDENIALQANRILAIEDGKITRDEVIRR